MLGLPSPCFRTFGNVGLGDFGEGAGLGTFMEVVGLLLLSLMISSDL